MTFEEKINKVHDEWRCIVENIKETDITQDFCTFAFNNYYNNKKILKSKNIHTMEYLIPIYLLLHIEFENPLTYLLKCKNLMIEKNKQYGDAILNPELYLISRNERETNIRGLINNKLNRLVNQTDHEDSLMDLLNYFCFLKMIDDE